MIGPTVESYITRWLSRGLVPTLLGFDPLLQFVHEVDALAALKLAIDREVSGIFNIAAEGVLPVSTVNQTCRKGQLALPPLSRRRAPDGVALARGPRRRTGADAAVPASPVRRGQRESPHGARFFPGYTTREAVLEFGTTLRLRELACSPRPTHDTARSPQAPLCSPFSAPQRGTLPSRSLIPRPPRSRRLRRRPRALRLHAGPALASPRAGPWRLVRQASLPPSANRCCPSLRPRVASSKASRPIASPPKPPAAKRVVTTPTAAQPGDPNGQPTGTRATPVTSCYTCGCRSGSKRMTTSGATARLPRSGARKRALPRWTPRIWRREKRAGSKPATRLARGSSASESTGDAAAIGSAKSPLSTDYYFRQYGAHGMRSLSAEVDESGSIRTWKRAPARCSKCCASATFA